MNLALGHAFDLKEIFHNFNTKKLKLTCAKAKEITNDEHRTRVIFKVFIYSMQIIFKDIIENNVTFLLPTGSRKADIHIKRYADDDFARGRQNGKWKDIDYLASYFSGYQMVLAMYNKDGKPVREKPIYIDRHQNEELTKQINNGKQYC